MSGRDAEDFREFRLHFWKVRQEFRTLREDIRIDIADLVPFLSNEICGLEQKLQTRDSFVPIVCVGKHFTDIAETTRSKQRIRDGVAQDVAIGVANQTLLMWNLDASEHQRRGRSQSMDVVANPDPEFQVVTCAPAVSSARNARASVRSLGLVILMLRSDPRTIATAWPSRSTRLDSSVP